METLEDAIDLEHGSDRARKLVRLRIMLMNPGKGLQRTKIIERAIHLARDNTSHETQPDKWRLSEKVMNRLSLAISDYYVRIGSVAGLEQVVRDAQKASRTSSDSSDSHHLHLPRQICNLGLLLVNRYDRYGKMVFTQKVIDMLKAMGNSTGDDDLDETIKSSKLAVQTAAPACVASQLEALNSLLFRRYNKTHHLADLDKAISRAKEAVDKSSSQQASDLARRYSILSEQNFERYLITSNKDSRDKAIKYAQRAVTHTSADDLQRAHRLRQLGRQLYVRSVKRNRKGKQDLNNAMDYSLTALHLIECQNGLDGYSELLGSILGDRSDQLLEQYRRTHRKEELDMAIDHARRAVTENKASNQHVGQGLIRLVSLTFLRHRRRGSAGDLQEAIERAETATDFLCKHEEGDLPELSNIVLRIARQQERVNRWGSLREASGPGVGNGTLKNGPDLAKLLNRLSEALLHRYREKWRSRFLYGAILTARKAVRMQADDSPSLADMLHRLATMILMWIDSNEEHKGISVTDAILFAKQAVGTIRKNDPRRDDMVNTLCQALAKKFVFCGNIKFLESSIDYARDVFNEHARRESIPAALLQTLAMSLYRRYERTNNSENLRDALEYAQLATLHTSPGDRQLFRRHTLLSEIMFADYRRKEDSEVLKKVVAQTQKSIDMMLDIDNHIIQEIPPTLGEDLARCFSILCRQLITQYRLEPEGRGLQRMAVNAELAEDFLPVEDYLTILKIRYEATGRKRDLITAVYEASCQCSRGNRDETIRLASSLIKMAEILSAEYEEYRREEVRDEMLKLYIDAAKSRGSTPLSRLMACQHALRILKDRKDWKQASSLAQEAIKLLPILCSRYLTRDDQQLVLAQTAGLAADACSLMLKAKEHPEKALECLEEGRGIILGYLMDSRSDISELRSEDSSLADGLETLLTQATLPISSLDSPKQEKYALGQREKAERGLEERLKKIRKRKGFSRFLLSLSSKQMKEEARENPIIVVNVTDLRSDAFIVSRRMQMQITQVLLPPLHGPAFRQYRPSSLGRDGFRDPAPIPDGDHDKYAKFLSLLWNKCVRIVLSKLRFLQHRAGSAATPLPRVWWVGTGRAASFPFHAAGDYSSCLDENTAADWDIAFNYVISSYTPTIKALRYVRQRSDSGQKPPQNQKIGSDLVRVRPSLLAVTMEETPGMTKLPGVKDERLAILEILQGNCEVNSFPDQTPSRVLAHLKESSIVHFACHGCSDPVDPSQSYLALEFEDSGQAHDKNHQHGKLTLQQIAEARLDQAWLAYLSACSTAENRVFNLSDEVLHLASGFQAAGFSHVVASLWPSSDKLQHKGNPKLSHASRDGGPMIGPGTDMPALRAVLTGSAWNDSPAAGGLRRSRVSQPHRSPEHTQLPNFQDLSVVRPKTLLQQLVLHVDDNPQPLGPARGHRLLSWHSQTDLLSHLHGCIRDAMAMEEFLRGNGVRNVTKLTARSSRSCPPLWVEYALMDDLFGQFIEFCDSKYPIVTDPEPSEVAVQTVVIHVDYSNNDPPRQFAILAGDGPWTMYVRDEEDGAEVEIQRVQEGPKYAPPEVWPLAESARDRLENFYAIENVAMGASLSVENGAYAIQNGESGRFIHITQATHQPKIRNPRSVDARHTVVRVDHIRSDPYTIKIGSEDGATFLSLTDTSDRAETGTAMTGNRTSQWVVKDHGSAEFHNFWNLKNSHTHTYLDVGDGSNQLIGAHKRHDSPSQYWRFVPIDQANVDSSFQVQVDAQKQLRHEKGAQYPQVQPVTYPLPQPQPQPQPQYNTGGNLCGDPTCVRRPDAEVGRGNAAEVRIEGGRGHRLQIKWLVVTSTWRPKSNNLIVGRPETFFNQVVLPSQQSRQVRRPLIPPHLARYRAALRLRRSYRRRVVALLDGLRCRHHAHSRPHGGSRYGTCGFRSAGIRGCQHSLEDLGAAGVRGDEDGELEEEVVEVGGLEYEEAKEDLLLYFATAGGHADVVDLFD
ncbi:hypothetical protein CNMCM7691_004828 [Aspergillus felis]|uniref:CHAT domain-containing protein n=1 Tax=Aspergillus felis TaxID=1287682 RepID=A0A8H6R477_9EURO|nr:hypothetical protein CNMCM7691_004828 [Aspergillus felis]